MFEDLRADETSHKLQKEVAADLMWCYGRCASESLVNSLRMFYLCDNFHLSAGSAFAYSGNLWLDVEMSVVFQLPLPDGGHEVSHITFLA